MKEFVIKCSFATFCLIVFVSFIPIQKYDFPDPKVRCNKFTGKVEYYSDYSGTWQTTG